MPHPMPSFPRRAAWACALAGALLAGCGEQDDDDQRSAQGCGQYARCHARCATAQGRKECTKTPAPACAPSDGGNDSDRSVCFGLERPQTRDVTRLGHDAPFCAASGGHGGARCGRADGLYRY